MSAGTEDGKPVQFHITDQSDHFSDTGRGRRLSLEQIKFSRETMSTSKRTLPLNKLELVRKQASCFMVT